MKLDPETLAALGYGVAPTDATIRAMLGSEREPTGLRLTRPPRPYMPTGGTPGRVISPGDGRLQREQTEREQRTRAHARRVGKARRDGTRERLTRAQWRAVYGPGGLSESVPAGAWLEVSPAGLSVLVSLQHARGACVTVYRVGPRGTVR